MTSKIRPADYFGNIKISQWKEAELLKPSVIKPVFAIIEKRLVIEKLGGLRKKDHNSLKEVLQTILGE